jgi:hypothetical protein
MQNLFKSLLEKLGRPSDPKSEMVAVLVVYCMFLSFSLASVLGAVSVSRLIGNGGFLHQSCPTTPAEHRIAQ